MRSAVDSTVLIDLFSASESYLKSSRRALERALSEGSLVACDIVWAEVRAHFASEEIFVRAMETTGVGFDPCDTRSASAAGAAWREYRRRGGSRQRLVPDFLIAAHALLCADRLLTRDRGFAGRYFRGLVIVDPTA